MDKQVIISVSREYGSGGHYIAEKLSKELGIELLDKNFLELIAKELNCDSDEIKKFDEAKNKLFINRTVRGMSSSAEDNFAKIQFEYIKKKAAEGKSMVVVGRCSEYVLRDYDCLISVFVMGDTDARIKRIVDVKKLNENEAKKAIIKMDSTRRAYHNDHCDTKWGDMKNYDLCINSSPIGLDAAVKLIKDYVISTMS